MCGPIYAFRYRHADEQRAQDPTRLETSASLHGDYLKSDQLEAIKRGEGYLREYLNFMGHSSIIFSTVLMLFCCELFSINNVQLLERSFYLCYYCGCMK